MALSHSKARVGSSASPFGSCPSLSSLADIMGERVRATTPEMATAPARVRANSRKSEPVRPPWKAMGA